AQHHAGRATIHDAADRRPVRFTEGSDAEQGAQGVAGHGSMLAGDASECSMRVELSRLTRAAGATVVEINPKATPLSSSADYVLRGAAEIGRASLGKECRSRWAAEQ